MAKRGDASDGQPPQWHAVVIGIDAYTHRPGAQLFGCVNDASAIRRFLVERVPVPEANLHYLTSPVDVAVPRAREATAANIRDAFAGLLKEGGVASGDHVVLFYAGHGIQLQRAASSGGKEHYYGFCSADVWGTADSGYTNLLLGREIYEFLSELQGQGVTATVIADTCHSGASMRGIDDAEDVRERSVHVPALSDTEWRAFESRHPALASTRGGGVADGLVNRFGTYDGGDFVLLTGCLDRETSKEYTLEIKNRNGTVVDRQKHGLLTATLLEQLQELSNEEVLSLRWMDFYDRLVDRVQRRATRLGRGPQTPACEGRREKPVFGGAWRPFTPAFTVRRSRDGVLAVDGGELQGLEVGARLAIYPPNTADLHDPGVRSVVAEVDAATPTTSTARVVGSAARVANGSRARLIRPAPKTKPIVIGIDPSAMPPEMKRVFSDGGGGDYTVLEIDRTDDQRVHAEVLRWRDAVPAGISNDAATWAGARGGWVLVARDQRGAPLHALSSAAVPHPNQIVAYLPETGGPLDRVDPERREEALGAALAAGATSLARYLAVRDRRAVDDTLADAVAATLRIGHGAWPIVADGEGTPQAYPRDGAYTAHYSEAPDHWIWLEVRVRRETKLPLHLAWILLSDDGDVKPLWPTDGQTVTHSSGWTGFIGQNREQALRLTKRVDQTTSMYTLRLLAFTAPEGEPPPNLSAIAQGTVQDAFAGALESYSRSRTRGGVARPSTGTRRRPDPPAWFAWDFRIAVTEDDAAASAFYRSEHSTTAPTDPDPGLEHSNNAEELGMPVEVVSEGGSQLTRELVLDDGTTILVEVTDVGQGTRGVFDTATKSFASAVDGLHKVATVLHREVTLAMETTAPDSVTVTFGIQISSEAGVIISKATAGATISVSMTWTRS